MKKSKVWHIIHLSGHSSNMPQQSGSLTQKKILVKSKKFKEGLPDGYQMITPHYSSVTDMLSNLDGGLSKTDVSMRTSPCFTILFTAWLPYRFHKLPNRNKTSWMHPRSKHWHLIDYVVVRRTDRQDVRVTKTMCGADCWTDHRLIVSKLNLRIQPARRPQGKKAPKRLDVSKLNHDSMRQAFINDISNQLGAMNLSSEDPEENWTVFQKVVHSSAVTTIGHPSRKHQDWFDENDEEIKLLLEEKHCLHKAHQDDTSSVSKRAAYNNICKTVQNRLRDMQDSWLSKKAEEIQSFADRKDMKKFHDALKTVYGPKRSGATPLLSADGSTLLTDKDAIFKRWSEHFNSVLNRPTSVNDNAINRLPQIECNVLLDEFPTVTETRKAIQHLSSGKAPGTDAIPAEVYKAGGLPMAEKN